MSMPARAAHAGAATDSEVLSPAPADADRLAQLLNFIEAHEARRDATSATSFYLTDIEEHDRVELTGQVHAILKRVVAALSTGQSISILTRDLEVTTQQAAEILGVSRPTVVRLIDSGELNAHIPGAERRKLLLTDVLAYREELRTRRNRFITDSSAEYADAESNNITDLLAKAHSAR
jgi:excisionase family DNA binding protein